MSQAKQKHQHAIGFVNRRELLQVGFTGLLGMGLTDILAGQAAAAPSRKGPKAKSVILAFMTGAPAHQDIWDIHPNAPSAYRGAGVAQKTNVPGMEISAWLPHLAKCADKYALVRSMTHGINSHEIGTHFMLTGVDKLPPGASFMASRNDWPSMMSGVMYNRPHRGGLPVAVELPTYLNNGYGFSGQNGGIMGSKYDPWLIRSDPNKASFRVPDLMPLPGMTVNRLGQRQALLQSVDRQRADLEAAGVVRQLDNAQGDAFKTLTDPRTRQAFDLAQEPTKLRDRYGRHMFGQSLLLARRLVESGVAIVQANMGHMNTWDTHTNLVNRLKNGLLPPFDSGMSALLEDLDERGLLEETLVIAVGEFGRTPKMGHDNGGGITAASGRDHWGGVFTALFAGGGVQGGRVVGKSDVEAAYPDGKGFHPSDMGATVYTALGVDPGMVFHDFQGRPFPLNKGEVIAELF